MASRGQLAVIILAKKAGFTEDGETSQQHVRIAQTNNPTYGKSGGQQVVLGGRARYAHSSGWKMTIGPRTTCLYRPDQTVPMENFNSTDYAAIKERLEALFQISLDEREEKN